MAKALFRYFLIGCCCGLITILLSTWAIAADHRDAPAVTNDPTADINDLYAFMNPNNADELILVLTVFPFADENARFSDAVSYNFLIENNLNQTFEISCVFSADQFMNCFGPSGIQVEGPVGTIAQSGSFRVFSGLRDDPFFLDLAALNATIAAGSPRFNNPGTNTFAGGNVLTIVVGINRSSLTANFVAPILKIYANTERR